MFHTGKRVESYVCAFACLITRVTPHSPTQFPFLEAKFNKKTIRGCSLVQCVSVSWSLASYTAKVVVAKRVCGTAFV